MGAVAFWLAIRYAGDRWWPATILLYAPRWPWLLPAPILIALAIRRPKVLWLPVLTAGFVLGPLMGFSIPWGRTAAATRAGEKVRLLVCNVHRQELDRAALDAYIRQAAPEVVLLQDYSGQDASPTLADPGWNRYRLGEIFIASRFPIARVHDLHLERITSPDDAESPRRTGSAACFDLQTPAGIVHVVNLHLASPHAGLRMLMHEPARGIRRLQANSLRRWQESRQVCQWLAEQTGPVIVAGDFNTPAESPIYRQFWAAYPDAFPTAGFGFGYTHFSSLSELRIDHLLTGTGIDCTGCEIGPPCGTPHRPIRADLVIRPAS